MKKIITVVTFLALFGLSFGQNCLDDRNLTGLRKGQVFTAPCDSMVVLTKPTYERMRWEEKQKSEIIASFERSQKLFDQKTLVMDSIVLRYKSHTDSLNKFLSEKQIQINKLDSLVICSVQNTDKAVKIAEKNQKLVLISGTITVVLLIITIFIN
jgi:hypothetical protein